MALQEAKAVMDREAKEVKETSEAKVVMDKAREGLDKGKEVTGRVKGVLDREAKEVMDKAREGLVQAKDKEVTDREAMAAREVSEVMAETNLTTRTIHSTQTITCQYTNPTTSE